MVEAANGLEAIAAVRRAMEAERRIDLLLTDVIMPGMSGPEAARQITELQPRIKVLFTTGYTGDLLASYGVSRQETPLLEKPFGLDTLAR